MKKYFPLLSVVIPVFILLLLSAGCSKDDMMPAAVADETSLTGNGNASRIAARSGSVTGLVLPADMVIKIVIYSRYFFSDVYYYTRDGRFRFDGLQDDIYTVEITNLKTSSVTRITGVKVRAGIVTDIGKIFIRE